MPNKVAQYRITLEMLKAGAAALEQCRDLGGHTPQTVCQAIFTAMLNAADCTPGTDLRKTFAWSRYELATEVHGGKVYRGVFADRPPLERDLALYAGMTLGAYRWKGYFYRYRKHCFLLGGSDKDWIWLYESDWKNPQFKAHLQAGRFRVNPIFCWQNLKCGQITNK